MSLASKPKELNNKKHYRWKESSVETIKQQQIQSLLDNFLDKTFHCNSERLKLAVENLNSIFDHSASLSNLKNLDRKVWWRMQKPMKEMDLTSPPKQRDPENLSLHYDESQKTIQKYTT